MERQGGWSRAVADWLLIACFAAAVGLPLAALALDLDPGPVLIENRPLHPRPVLAWTKRALRAYPRAFEAYWGDAFPFRRTLIRWHNLAKLHLGVSPSDTVLVGRERWLFLRAFHGLRYYRAEQPFTPAELEQWRRALESRHDWLAARGIGYLFVAAPNKDSIYPEFMPARVRRAHAQSRLDQLVAHLGPRSRVPLLDLRHALLAAKGEDRLYRTTDTHWNDRGVRVAYDAILRRLQEWLPEIRPLPATAFEPYVRTLPGGDLAVMLGLPDVLPEESLELIPRVPRAGKPVAAVPRGAFWDTLDMETGRPELPRAIVLHDSFMVMLLPFLSEHFSRVVYVWGDQLDPALVERERPHVVIEERVERNLFEPAPGQTADSAPGAGAGPDRR
jgi:hypothetical protein